MGRHSKPDPEDSVDEPSDEELGHLDGGYPDAAEYPGSARPPGADYYAAEDTFAAGTSDDYPEFPPRPAGAASAEPPPSHPPGGHRGLGAWRGGHRSDGGRRGVSIGVIVALVAVVVVVGTVILWTFFGDVLSNRSHSAAVRCVSGKETVAVIADPSIADSVQQFAESYNSSAG